MTMTIKMTEGLHLTATNKRHICEMIQKGMMEGGTKSLYYVFSECGEGSARLSIIKTERDDFGRSIRRKQFVAIEYKHMEDAQ